MPHPVYQFTVDPIGQRFGRFVTFVVATFTLVVSGLAAEAKPANAPPNVLFICIDDLRNEVGYLGASRARTPALDRFAATGISFSRHYVQVPTCGASRAALMRGRYPDSPATVNNNAILKTHTEWADKSLPAWFRSHGYQTHSLGKVTHYPGNLAGENWAAPPVELPGGWDRAEIPAGPWPHAEAIMHGFAGGRARVRGQSPAIESTAGPDSLYPDAWVADEATKWLTELMATDSPWFLAVGFFKPHLPFAAPKAWFDRHDPADFDPPPNASRPSWPSGWHGSGEFRGNYGHQGRDPENDEAYARQLRHAYAAAVSYMDHQLGRLLETLDRLDPDRETVVVIWGDHGFLLGEHAIWGKHCLYEEALRSPLIIRQPGNTGPGSVSAAIVETVDIYPTLTELCGLPTPAELSGRSLRPWLDSPNAPSDKPARGFWTAGSQTIRTPRYRLIRTGRRGDRPPAIELFDYDSDPAETRNVAADHPATVDELTRLLDAD